MANPEHLAILKQGVEVWNKWRFNNDEVQADLSRANLRGIILSDVNFSRVNLKDVILTEAILTEPDFRAADLSGALLNESNLIRADFIEANLQRTMFSDASLIDAVFKDADLRRSNLMGAKCTGADFSNANLRETALSMAFFLKTSFAEADLRDAVLILSNLTKANLRGANITGAYLYGTSREDWIIDSVICEYVFWDQRGDCKTPKERDFKSGEFEQLYKHLPTLEYYFEHGFTPVDAIIMDRIVQAINERHPGYKLKLDSFHSRGQPHAVFTVLHKEAAEEALNQIKAGYEARIAKLEGERETLERCFNRALEEPRTIIKRIEMGDTYEIKGQAGAVGRGAHAHDINFNQAWNDISKDIDLTKLQVELVILREAIQREAKSSEQYHALAEVSDAETAAKAGNGLKVVEHMKKAGKWTFDVARDIGTDVAAEVIKKSLGL